MPVILSVSQSTVSSDGNGLASVVPSSGGFGGPVEVDVAVTAGTAAMLDYPLQILPALGNENSYAIDGGADEPALSEVEGSARGGTGVVDRAVALLPRTRRPGLHDF